MSTLDGNADDASTKEVSIYSDTHSQSSLKLNFGGTRLNIISTNSKWLGIGCDAQPFWCMFCV